MTEPWSCWWVEPGIGKTALCQQLAGFVGTRNGLALIGQCDRALLSISALFGLTNGIIDQTQYPILVTVVILSAVVPTLMAQTWFRPGVVIEDGEELEAALEPVPLAHAHDGLHRPAPDRPPVTALTGDNHSHGDG